MGKTNENLVRVNIVVMREGPHLSINQRRRLEILVTESKIIHAVMDIGDIKASVIEGFGSKFYKESRNTIK